VSIGVCHGERETWTDATRSEERRLEDASSEFQLVAAAQCGDSFGMSSGSDFQLRCGDGGFGNSN